MAAIGTNRAKYRLAAGTLTTTTDLRAGLLGTQEVSSADWALIPDCNTVADLLALGTATELTGVSGYGRQALASKTVTEDDTNNWALLDAADVVFASLGAGDTIHGWFLYVYNASDASADLLAVYDLAATPTVGADYTLLITSGFARIT